jgi:hypothetical protein
MSMGWKDLPAPSIPSIMESMDKLWAQACQLPTSALLVTGTTVLFVLHRFFFTSPAYPVGLPLVAEPQGRTWFSPRTRWRYYTDCASLYSEAYTKVSWWDSQRY